MQGNDYITHNGKPIGMTFFQSEEYQSYKGMITILLNSINSARLPCLFGSRAELIWFGKNHFIVIQILQLQYNLHHSLQPPVIIPTFLFPFYFIRGFTYSYQAGTSILHNRLYIAKTSVDISLFISFSIWHTKVD